MNGRDKQVRSLLTRFELGAKGHLIHAADRLVL